MGMTEADIVPMDTLAFGPVFGASSLPAAGA